jgi:hypothetical protein
MKRLVLSVALALATAFSVATACAATADEEKAFVNAYKTAFAAKDANGLQALLYTDGADPMALQFYGQMMTAELANGTLSSIELQDLTADEVTAAATPQDGPNGKFVLAPKPYKKLALKIDSKTADGMASSTSTVFVAEIGGKIVICTPGKAK